MTTPNAAAIAQAVASTALSASLDKHASTRVKTANRSMMLMATAFVLVISNTVVLTVASQHQQQQ